MFLIERPVASLFLRADLVPRQLFGGDGGLIRTALAMRPSAQDAAAPLDRAAAPSERDRPAPVRHRKVG